MTTTTAGTDLEFWASDRNRPLLELIRQRIPKSTRLDISVAFLGDHDNLIGWVEEDHQRRIRLVVGLRFPTSPDALRRLMAHPQVVLKGMSNGSEGSFHEKIVLAFDAPGAPFGAYVGSANWTNGGLTRNVEAGTWITRLSTLQDIQSHVSSIFDRARQVTVDDLDELDADHRWHAARGQRPKKSKGTLRKAWKSLSAGGRWILKQNGTKEDPFREGLEEFRDRNRHHASQTFNRLPKHIEAGQGVILTWISRRPDSGPDRLIYGRGRVAGVDPEKWRLPPRYVQLLEAKFGKSDHRVRHIQRWEDIIWLDPVEIIDYPRGCREYLWLREVTGAGSFQKGFRYASEDEWLALNKAIDEATEKFGVIGPDYRGLWWNQFLDITDESDELFMTQERIEELNS